jgi:phosphatidylserine/phosphatidylglycerophosphate/cardiolipin synthase-like enzyme
VGPPHSWPRDTSTDYTSLAGAAVPKDRLPSDLPDRDPKTSKDIYGVDDQIWHDQHLMLRGPIVRTLEQQFAERWRESARFYDLSQPARLFAGQVIFSTAEAIDADDEVIDLPDTTASPGGGASAVQMWRTIPWRDARTRPPFQRAEFTAMAGINHAVKQSNELIWMFDQYFWSLPLARQLNYELTQKPGLHVIVILPPYADVQHAVAHEARAHALDALCAGVRTRVGAYNLWDHRGAGRGIYCHAKTHTYDGGLLVCGSANLNRRSFLCDSELACAVADETVVHSHQERLWTLLFRDVGTPFPAGLDLDDAGSGATFFAAFTAAAADSASYLARDPWELQTQDFKLPNGVAMPRGGLASGFKVDHILDPTSVDPALIEGQVDSGAGPGPLQTRPARLDDVVQRLEATVVRFGEVQMPNRRQSSDIRLPLIEVDPNLTL